MNDLFSFEGRMNRKQFFLINIIAYAVIVPVQLVIANIGAGSSLNALIAALAFAVYALVISSSYARRAHDVNASGAMAFLAFVPIFNTFTFLVLSIVKGEPEENWYGAPVA